MGELTVSINIKYVGCVCVCAEQETINRNHQMMS